MTMMVITILMMITVICSCNSIDHGFRDVQSFSADTENI